MPESSTMKKIAAGCILFSVLGLYGCAQAPENETEVPASEPVPEITLNLPKNECDCTAEDGDHTFLEKGFDALHRGEYLDSLQYFQRYQRIEKTPLADTEAKIAIAYLSILPDSPIFDSRAVSDSYNTLRQQIEPQWKLHDQILLMQDSLETFIDMQRKISQLEDQNAVLREELAAREEAIKRLRDLTLGREPAAAE
jgi:hypothetical protein